MIGHRGLTQGHCLGGVASPAKNHARMIQGVNLGIDLEGFAESRVPDGRDGAFEGVLFGASVCGFPGGADGGVVAGRDSAGH